MRDPYSVRENDDGYFEVRKNGRELALPMVFEATATGGYHAVRHMSTLNLEHYFEKNQADLLNIYAAVRAGEFTGELGSRRFVHDSLRCDATRAARIYTAHFELAHTFRFYLDRKLIEVTAESDVLPTLRLVAPVCLWCCKLPWTDTKVAVDLRNWVSGKEGA